jgi:hypothetical protein
VQTVEESAGKVAPSPETAALLRVEKARATTSIEVTARVMLTVEIVD